MSKLSSQEIDLDAFSESLNTESPRACGILGAALLDAKLEGLFRRCLCSFQDDLLGNSGSLGAFSARIRTARALAWISEDARVDLDTIRGIRNDFAHSFDHTLDFDDPSISDRCRNLRSSQAYLDGFDIAASKPIRQLSSEAIRAMQSVFTAPRARYQLAVEFLSQYIDCIRGDASDYEGSDLLTEVRDLSANARIRVSGTGTVT